MTTVIYGHSDDTLVVDGKGIDQDFNVFCHKKGDSSARMEQSFPTTTTTSACGVLM